MNKTMHAAICDYPEHIEIKTVPVPRINQDKVLVKVEMCGVCNSDLVAFHGGGYKKYPYSPGHEFYGIIAALGKDVSGFQLGQRVVANPNLGCGKCRYCIAGKSNLCDYLKTRDIKSNGGFAEYVALDAKMIYPLPDSFPLELATFIEPLSCAVHVADIVNAAPGERIGIFGAGCMGLFTGLVLKSLDCEMFLIELFAARRRQMSELLNVAAFSPEEFIVSDIAGTLDVAVDCSGSAKAVGAAIKMLRKTGRLILASLIMNTEGINISLNEIATKELQIKGAWLNPDTFKKAIELVVEHKDILSLLKTEIFALEDIAKAFQRKAISGIDKIIIRI